jgi:hypothetical protein
MARATLRLLQRQVTRAAARGKDAPLEGVQTSDEATPDAEEATSWHARCHAGRRLTIGCEKRCTGCIISTVSLETREPRQHLASPGVRLRPRDC